MEDLKVELEELKEESDLGKLAETPAAVRPARRRWVWAGAALVVVSLAVALWLFRGTDKKPAAAPELVPLTSYAGSERSPSFSPDGNQVVFSWNGEKQDNADIYLKLIGSPRVDRLTTDPSEDISPAFSPDGRSIGFVRVSKGRASFIIIPAIGGPERIVAEVPAPRWPASFVERAFAWLPDGKWVITDGLVLLSTESGATRSLTSPLTKSSFDSSPAISPDGYTVAFSRTAGMNSSDIYLLDLTEGLKPKGELRRLTSLNGQTFSSAWTPNGREIIFTSWASEKRSLWRVPASGAGEPVQLPFSVGAASSPAISWTGNRLAYDLGSPDSNIWRLSLAAPGMASGSPVRFIASTRQDLAAQYSPEGKRIAFESERSGVHGICDADSTNPVPLLPGEGASSGTAHWSPDGQRIAFDFNPEANYDIYVTRASGGKPIPLTTDSGDDMAASWSRDGKWVYFTSRRTGRDEVWKVLAGGGEAVPVTQNGGDAALESVDGRFIYYTKGGNSASLWKMPLSGGEETQVLPSVHARDFFVVNEGIYFIPAPGTDRKSSIQFLSFATAKVKTVAPMSGLPYEGLSVSPDGRSLLFAQWDELGIDLMLVENFR
jgi:Tol biopolymer transport system component